MKTRFENLCDEYRENKRLIEELESMNDGIKAAILEIMDGQETMTQGASKATNKTVTSSRLDGKALERDKPEIFKAYKVTSTYKRFTVA